MIIGIIVEKIILARLKKFAVKTRWEGDEIIIASIRGSPVLCFGIAGVYGALMNLPLQPAANDLFMKILLVVIMFAITIVIAKLAVGFINLQNKKAAGALPSTSLFVNLARIIIFVIPSHILFGRDKRFPASCRVGRKESACRPMFRPDCGRYKALHSCRGNWPGKQSDLLQNCFPLSKS